MAKKPFRVHHLLKLAAMLAFGVVMALLVLILAIIFLKSGRSLSFQFLTDSPSGFPIGTEGGIYPAIIGSLCFTLVASSFAFVLALALALFLEFYCRQEGLERAIRVTVGTIAGIPSIVLGLFGYSFLVVNLGLGISVLSGGLVLGLMVFPFMEIRFERIFRDLNDDYRIRAKSLGINTIFYILHIIFPLAWRDLVATVSLTASMAIGAAAPLILTGAVFFAGIPDSLRAPAMALPVHLYHLIADGISVEKAFATAAVLLLLLLALNLTSWFFRRGGEKS